VQSFLFSVHYAITLWFISFHTNFWTSKKKRKNKLREVDDDEQAIGDGSAPFMEQPPLGAS
jgi:hypothetical protein